MKMTETKVSPNLRQKKGLEQATPELKQRFFEAISRRHMSLTDSLHLLPGFGFGHSVTISLRFGKDYKEFLKATEDDIFRLTGFGNATRGTLLVEMIRYCNEQETAKAGLLKEDEMAISANKAKIESDRQRAEQLATPQLKEQFKQDVQNYRALREISGNEQLPEQHLTAIFKKLPHFGEIGAEHLLEHFDYDLEKIMRAPESELRKARNTESLKARMIFVLTSYCNEKDVEKARTFGEPMVEEVRVFTMRLLHKNHIQDGDGIALAALLRRAAGK
jgi:hypothetical protein